MPFRLERGSADIRDGFYGTVLLLLFESGAKPVDASVAVHVERTRTVGESVPIGENQNRRSRKLRQDFSNQFFHSGLERKLNPFPEKRVNRARPRGQVGKNFAVIVDTTHQRTDLLHIRGHRHKAGAAILQL